MKIFKVLPIACCYFISLAANATCDQNKDVMQELGFNTSELLSLPKRAGFFSKVLSQECDIAEELWSDVQCRLSETIMLDNNYNSDHTLSLSEQAQLSNTLKKELSGCQKISQNTNSEIINSDLTVYETFIPNKTKVVFSSFEKSVLSLYLENPNELYFAEVLAIYHLNRSLLDYSAEKGQAVKHTILAKYFLNRAIHLGQEKTWAQSLIVLLDHRFDPYLNSDEVPFSEETDAHLAFIKSFNYEESDRYSVIDGLLTEFTQTPNNILTNTYLTSSNIWIGGEAEYEDPNIIYSFIVSSFFSIRAVEMAEKMEIDWSNNPNTGKKFRLSNILGGFAVPARRWLAKLHGDESVVNLLDEEHRQWLKINRAFHSFTVGLMLFDENKNFTEGYDAWMAALDHCSEKPNFRSCIDRPRLSFNRIGYLLGAIDFFMKNGELNKAKTFLTYRYLPSFEFNNWDLGRAAWKHREENFDQIAELYINQDPNDDPTHFQLKSHKWGPNTITCQTCHQAQSRIWSEDDINTIQLPDNGSVPTIGNWPLITTTWFATKKN
ncbi:MULTISPECIES: hypothetical protein [unclassified Pseudoalteromonas]|uniref:hypothetical protein n=1 Tax=unclassified Pseudoalteromonas TaxID=194690 RepID=UPI0005AABD24|nr:MULTISPECIES: hypothetical protein [unclassified Pseudoalteromonas]